LKFLTKLASLDNAGNVIGSHPDLAKMVQHMFGITLKYESNRQRLGTGDSADTGPSCVRNILDDTKHLPVDDAPESDDLSPLPILMKLHPSNAIIFGHLSSFLKPRAHNALVAVQTRINQVAKFFS
jgi:hypothetical protein